MALDHGGLRKSVLYWSEWLKKTSQQLFARDFIQNPIEGMGLAYVGVRRSGKTFFAIQATKNNLDRTFYFNFEDPVLMGHEEVSVIDELIEIYEEEYGHKPSHVILDEVHNIHAWERWARREIDLGRFQVSITGSSSKLLSSELATSVAGRAIEKPIWPLSFAEHLRFQNLSPKSEPQYLRELKQYFFWGGFPKVVLTPQEEEKILLLKQYLSDIVLKDVIARHHIKDVRHLEQLVSWYLSNVSCLHSYTAIRKAFGFSIEMISALTRYLAEAFLVFEINRYHPNLKVQSRDPKKVYLIDNGLRTVSLGTDRAEEIGRLAENAVFIELKRRGKGVSYFKEKGEVDFVLTKLGKPVEAIQVCYSDLKNQATYQREVDSLVECLESLKFKTGIVLTMNVEREEKILDKKIKFIPIYRWMLRPTGFDLDLAGGDDRGNF